MSSLRLWPMAAIAIVLSGCATQTPEERRTADERTCMSYGFRRNTDAFATCLQRIDLDRREERRAMRYGNDGLYGNRPFAW